MSAGAKLYTHLYNRYCSRAESEHNCIRCNWKSQIIRVALNLNACQYISKQHMGTGSESLN
jgi:hypothetical protein